MQSTDTRRWTLAAIRQANRDADGHCNDASPRRFTVRQFDPATGDVDTFGEFNELGRAAAVTLAKLCASGA